MAIYNKLHGGAQGSTNAPARVFSAAQFLGKDPEAKGYTNPTSFLAYAESLRPIEADQLETVFGFFKENVRIVGAMPKRYDRAKRQYVHPEFLLGNARQGCKIILEAGMYQFLTDYMNGLVGIDFTADELIDEALSK